MNRDELNLILDQHAKWLREGPEGTQANLRGADLCGADLRGADLRGADLRGANLRDANLRDANLRDADLRGAYLCGANLRDANLSRANLSRANMSRADLSRANLRGANLRGANLPAFYHCPEVGTFTAFKKLQGGVVATLEIPADAKRTSSLVGRKCRAEFATVKTLTNADGTPAESGVSMRDGETRYVVGETVKPDSYDDNPAVECTHGIHFFITRKEAEEYS